jgi:DNA invertase Pin-like site-specific DNA recombinase
MYVRVSTEDQNLERQKQLIKSFVSQKFSGRDISFSFQEKISGKNMSRPELFRLLNEIEPEDVVIVESFSRISRNTSDLNFLIKTFQEKKVNFISLKESFHLNENQGAMGMFMAHLFSAVAEMERSLIRERQSEGIAIAKSLNLYQGRKPIPIPSIFFECYEKYKNSNPFKKYTITQFAKDLKLTVSTTRNLISEYHLDPLFSERKKKIEMYANQKKKLREKNL